MKSTYNESADEVTTTIMVPLTVSLQWFALDEGDNETPMDRETAIKLNEAVATEMARRLSNPRDLEIEDMGEDINEMLMSDNDSSQPSAVRTAVNQLGIDWSYVNYGGGAGFGE